MNCISQSPQPLLQTQNMQEVQSIQLSNHWSVSILTLASYEATPPPKTESSEMKSKICGEVSNKLSVISQHTNNNFSPLATLWIQKAIESVIYSDYC